MVCVIVGAMHHEVVKKVWFPTDIFSKVYKFLHHTFQITWFQWNRDVVQRVS